MDIKGWFTGNPSPGHSYAVTVVCTNCGCIVEVRIAHGKSVEKWSRRAKCGRCKTVGRFVKS